MNSRDHTSQECDTRLTVSGSPFGRRVRSKDIYEWALYELSSARWVEVSSGIDTSDLRQQIIAALQRDLYTKVGDHLTI